MSNPRYRYEFDINWPDDLPYQGLFADVDEYLEIREKTFTPWICVEGYETSISTDEIKELLTEHFKDCGRITDVYIPSDNKGCAYIFIAGIGAALRAVELTGTEVGGRKIDVYISMIPRNETITDDGPYGNTNVPLPTFASGTTFPDIPRNNTVTDCGPYGYTHPGQRVVAEPKSFPLPTFGSGMPFPGPYGYTHPGPYGYAHPGPYVHTHPGHRIVTESKSFPLPTFGCSPFSEFAEVGSAKRALEQSGSYVGGRKIAAYVSDTPKNNTIKDCGPCGNTRPGLRIVAEPKTFPEVTSCTFGSGSTVPADCINKVEKMTEE